MENFGGLGIGIAALAIVLVVTFLILSNAITQIQTADSVNATTCKNATATAGSASVSCNAAHTLTTAVATIPGWVSLIVITVIGATLIGLVAMFRRR